MSASFLYRNNILINFTFTIGNVKINTNFFRNAFYNPRHYFKEKATEAGIKKNILTSNSQISILRPQK